MIELLCRQAGSSIIVGYQDVVLDIERQIDSGELVRGQRLPSIAEMAEHYRLAPTTIKTALAVLRGKGRVRGEQGRATFVVG